MNNSISLYGEQFRVIAEHRYTENRDQPVLQIFEVETGTPGGVLSVCIPGARLNQDETILKSLFGLDIVETLEKAGIAQRTNRLIQSGYGKYPVVKLNNKFMLKFGSTKH
jgi:hypothetical protein